jgi:DNA-directed RNA polymerase subunit beta
LNLEKCNSKDFIVLLKKVWLKNPNNFPKIEIPNQEFEFELFGEEFQLVEPIMKERKAIYQSSMYSSNLYVSAWLTQKKGGAGGIQKQIVFVGSIPLMIFQGTFVINGVAKVIINQNFTKSRYLL